MSRPMTAISSASVQVEPSLFLYPDRDALGRAAARQSAEIISRALQTRGSARILVATGNSQLSLIEHLTAANLEFEMTLDLK